jgi:hypothetical protein
MGNKKSLSLYPALLHLTTADIFNSKELLTDNFLKSFKEQIKNT